MRMGHDGTASAALRFLTVRSTSAFGAMPRLFRLNIGGSRYLPLSRFTFAMKPSFRYAAFNASGGKPESDFYAKDDFLTMPIEQRRKVT